MSCLSSPILNRIRLLESDIQCTIFARVTAFMGLSTIKSSLDWVNWKTWQQYGQGFPGRCESLLGEFRSGRYRAPAIHRVYIQKDKHSQRPLGIPTIEDKVLQESVRKVIDPIFEEEFKAFSYGVRPGRSQHQAINYMFRKVSFEKMHYIIDADIKDSFGSINHGILRDFISIFLLSIILF